MKRYEMELMNAPPRYEAFRQKAARLFLVAIYLAAGILHVMLPGPFLFILPHWVPEPRFTIFITGLCEIAGAIGLCTARYRRPAGVALALYAVAVFPANINHAQLDLASAHPVLGWWYHIPRLALQPVLVWLALWVSRPGNNF